MLYSGCEVIALDKYYDMSRLLDFYGEILSERQRLAMQLYYNDDLSLSEVAQELGISRQGVRASLKRSEETLTGMESKLGLAARFDKTVKGFEQLRTYAESVKEQSRLDGDEKLMRFAETVAAFTGRLEKEI